MTGSSLWLVPPEDSELYKAIHGLILSQVPAVYSTSAPTQFTPHVTLTADTVTHDSRPSQSQEWLHGIELPDVTQLHVAIGAVDVGDVFFRKITMRCEKTTQLCDLAAHCRAAGVRDAGGMDGAREWVGGEYRPHCSLM